MNNTNKQFIAVLMFILFIGISIVGIIISDKNDTKKEVDSNPSSNVVEVVDRGNVPEVEESKPVKIITSNNSVSNSIKSNSSSNKVSNKVSNKPSNQKSDGIKISNQNDSKNIPVSYFITELSGNKIYVGGQSKLNITIYPKNATIQEVKFSSSNEKVARVTSSGTIVGVSSGVCYIDIEVTGGGNSRVQIEVLNKPVSNVTSNNKTSNNSNVTSNKSNVTSNKSNSTSNKSNVTSNKSNSNTNIAVSSVTLNTTSISLYTTGTAKLTATINPSNATNKSLTWTSSNTSVATVSNGIITPKSAGKTTITVKTNNGKTATCVVTVTTPVVKNGWYIEGGKKYYYKNGQKVKNSYVEYIYLDGNGVAQDKIGPFSATMYGARAWANQTLNIRQQANSSSTKLGTVPTGGKMTILSAVTNGYVKMQYNNITGYVYADYIFINLPDVIPDVIYEISNANSSIFKTAGISIPNITGKNLYNFSKSYNSKIGKTTYYAPLLYPVAIKFQKAYNSAQAAGYNFKVYDTYRPRPAAELIVKNYKALYDSNNTVKNKVNYDNSGKYWGYTWFISATGASRHCQGIALDLALTDKSGKELSAQSKMHTLDTSSLRKYNNDVANNLSKFMTGAGFSTLESEWWHYEDNTYKNNAYNTFYIS